MKQCKCGSTEFQAVHEHTTTEYSTVDKDGEPDEVVYTEEVDREFIQYFCPICHAQYNTWNDIPEA